MEVRERVAFVTGGASGLGEATVRHLVAQGAEVAVADSDAERGEALAAALRGRALFVHCDVTSERQVTDALDRALSAFAGLHIAVNCAGVARGGRTIRKEGPHSLTDFKQVVEVNLFGTFCVASQAAFRMASNQPDAEGCRGVIVNTASIAAFDGQIGQAAYAASKGAIASLTLPMARDLAALGIRVCSICPGVFDTPLVGRLKANVKASLASDIPYPRRLGRPEEFALLVEQIVRNSYLNAESIRLDGGLRMAPK